LVQTIWEVWRPSISRQWASTPDEDSYCHLGRELEVTRQERDILKKSRHTQPELSGIPLSAFLVQESGQALLVEEGALHRCLEESRHA
jgi:hypothetical protein